MTTFLFLRITHDPCVRRQSGDTRRAARSSISIILDPAHPVAPACAGLPDRDTD
jgi:hypothetical protein